MSFDVSRERYCKVRARRIILSYVKQISTSKRAFSLSLCRTKEYTPKKKEKKKKPQSSNRILHPARAYKIKANGNPSVPVETRSSASSVARARVSLFSLLCLSLSRSIDRSIVYLFFPFEAAVILVSKTSNWKIRSVPFLFPARLFFLNPCVIMNATTSCVYD